jgi:putative membrane protein
MGVLLNWTGETPIPQTQSRITARGKWMQLFFKSTKGATADGQKPKKRSSDRVRDHLANERTYLAWMRSAIALMGFGVLIVRLRILRPPMAPQPPGAGWKLGLAFSIVGLLMVLLSTQHYFAVRYDIDEDAYEPGDRWVILSSIAVLLLGAGVIYYVFTVPLEALNSIVLD